MVMRKTQWIVCVLWLLPFWLNVSAAHIQKVFKQPQPLIPAKNTFVYQPNVALFSDYAQKRRTITVPEGKKIRRAGEAYVFPAGTILSKTFFYPQRASYILPSTHNHTQAIEIPLETQAYRLIETRLLIKTQQGWKAEVYRWNNGTTERYPLGDGVKLTLLMPNREEVPFTYQIPNEHQCQQCHTVHDSKKSLKPLGFQPYWLHHPGHALPLWRQALSQVLDEPKPFQRKKASVEWARDYLAINCSHCHQPQGLARNVNLDFRVTTTQSEQLGICKPATSWSQGGKWVIEPGQPEKSILLKRMTSQDNRLMMPEIGRSLIDSEGTRRIKQWISRLQNTCQ